MKFKDSFSLLFNNLWQIDEDKLAKIKPDGGVFNRKWRLANSKSQKTIESKTQVATPIATQIIREILPQNVAQATPQITTPPITAQQITTSQTIPQIPNTNLITTWDVLEGMVNNCTKCKLANLRKNVVLERGNRNASWMFVGEAPGQDEDLQGKAFVGLSGQLLDKMITAMGLNVNNDVYICNVIKCRPPANRNPEMEEIQLCNNYLLSQINLVKPKFIITLGRFATQTLLNTTVATAKLRGRVHQFQNIPVVVSYHPSYLLRNPSAKKDAWDDLQLALRSFK